MEPNSAGRRATSTSALVEHLQWLLANTGRIPPASLQGLSLGPADLASIARQDPFVASQVARSLGAAPRAPRSTPPPNGWRCPNATRPAGAGGRSPTTAGRPHPARSDRPATPPPR